MDTAKAKGNYSSAYKLSRSTINNKVVRRERRSIEQKELRHEEVNKRRNLCDLSPLQEGDATSAQDKSYKDKTPVKTKKDDKLKKGLDRLEQLKKWKQERERKRKQEEEEARKRNPVFRVSKTVEHGDTRLFGKSNTRNHPVHPKSAPVSKTSNQKVPVSYKKPAAQSKPGHSNAASKPLVETRSRQTTQAAGKQRSTTATRSSSRGAKAELIAAEKINKKEKAPVSKPNVPTTRTLRSARQATVAAEPTSRTTRQAVKEKASDSKFKSASVPKPVFEPHEERADSPELNLTRVTRRGDISELPADSFTQTTDFGFNASSFVFRPLSPASAAGFLCMTQDTSCSSFLETNPKRSSTPKKEKNQETNKPEDDTVNNTVLQQTDVNLTHDVTQVNNTVIEQKDKTVIASPDAKNSSVRRSRRSAKPVECEPDTDKDETTAETTINEKGNSEKGKKSTPRRSTRRSVSSTVTTEKIEAQTERIKSTPRRSLRQSVLSTSIEVEDSTKSVEEAQKPRQSSRRRSAVANSDSDSIDNSEIENASSPMKRRRSLRRSLRSVDSDSENAAEKTTPRDQRKSRRSVALVCEQKTIEEIPEDSDSSQGNNEVFEEKDDVDENKENAGLTDGVSIVQKPTLSDSGVDLALPSENTTPTVSKRKQRSRNKSFGGFRLPDADSVVLSAKRKPRRKTLMPKRPEEWIEVLNNSPMVEMTRRKHKLGDTSLPTLNFDDIDLEEPESSMATEEVKATGSESSTAAATERNEVSPIAMETEKDDNKENDPEAINGTSDTAVVQVGEVSSTQDGPVSDESSSDTEQDVPYFRKLLCTETDRLNGLSSHWNLINDSTELSEEIHGQIRTTVGQAKLLMDQRFKQFSGLIDNCEFKLGEKETTCMDLKGFWEMIYYQVEDVDMKFEELKKLKDNNWVDDKPKPVVKKVKKKVAKPVVDKAAVKSKFAAFRAQMKKQKESVSSPVPTNKEEEKVFEVPGFFTVSSPVRSPKPHCEGGTPKKATPSSARKEEKQVSKDVLTLPSSSEMLVNRTPARKSYLPAVPSPLLQDTTPLPRPTRTCTQKTPVPKRLIDEVDSSEPDVLESESKRTRRTPARRSLRPRKSVNFSETVGIETVSSPAVEESDADFSRLLQPMEPTEVKSDEPLNDSFSKYLQPLSTLDTTLEKEDTPKHRRNRRSSLKGCRSTERRRSRQRSVHFASPSGQDVQHVNLPHTPYNKDSLVKCKRVTRRSHQIEDDVFSIDNIDNDENIPPPSLRSPRPSLLGTPPDMKRGQARVTSYVPTGTLISFTP